LPAPGAGTSAAVHVHRGRQAPNHGTRAHHQRPPIKRSVHWSPNTSSSTSRARGGTSSSVKITAHSASTCSAVERCRYLTRKRMSSASRRRENLHRQQMLGRRGRHPQTWMIEYPGRSRVATRRDKDACLLVQPPPGPTELISDRPGLFQDNTVRLEDRVDVPSRSSRIVSESHRGSTAKHLTGRSSRCGCLLERGLRSLPTRLDSKQPIGGPRLAGAGGVAGSCVPWLRGVPGRVGCGSAIRR